MGEGAFGGPGEDTCCSWQDTKVWYPGAAPKPSWSMTGGSSWLWIWTRIPASYRVSSVGEEGPKPCCSPFSPGMGAGDSFRAACQALTPPHLTPPVMSQPCPPPSHKKVCAAGRTPAPPLLPGTFCSPSLPRSSLTHVFHTHVLPHGQILILLHVQHDLQPVAHAALGSGERLCPVSTGVEGVALPHPGEGLRVGRRGRPHPRARSPAGQTGPWDLSLPLPLLGSLL